MEQLSADEQHSFICHLKTLSESLDNVVRLLQKRKSGKHSFLDLATTAQMNVEVMYREMINDRSEDGLHEQTPTEAPKIHLASTGPRRQSGRI